MVKYASVIATIRIGMLEPSAATTTMVKRMSGTDIKISRHRIIAMSTFPPKYPAAAPRRLPKTQEVTEANSDMAKEVLAPCTNLAKTSRPYMSVPMKCSADGAAKLFMTSWEMAA